MPAPGRWGSAWIVAQQHLGYVQAMQPQVNIQPPKELDRRPEARAYSIEQLIHHVRDGRVRVPRFQRGLKWQMYDAAQLLDSIYRGYPIGTLLFWQKRGDVGILQYGSVKVPAPEMTDALWVVDGQQRISSLVRTLIGAGYPSEEFALFFDVNTQHFVRPRRGTKIPSYYVPLTEVLDSERLLAWILDHGTGLDRGIIIHLGKRLREYQVPAYIVVTPDESAVREIFRRTNSTGKRMEDSDVFNAIYGAQGGASPSDLREVSAKLDELGFGHVEERVLHRMMLATLGTDVSRSKLPNLSKEQAQQAVLDVYRAASPVIAFLREHAGIPHLSLLPYSETLVMLTRFYHLYANPDPRSCELLARWLWRGAISQQHQGSAVTTQEALDAIGNDEYSAVQSLLRTIRKPRRSRIPLGNYKFSFAMSKIQTLAMLGLKPRHLSSGMPLLLGSPAGEEVPLPPPVIFAKSKRRDSLANRLLHPPMMGLRGRTVGINADSPALRNAIINCQDPAVLESHAISGEAHKALRASDTERFIVLRERSLRKVVDQFVASRARWKDSDRPPLTALVIRDEE